MEMDILWFRALNGWAGMNFFTDEVYVFMARDLIYVVALLALVLLLFSSRPFFDNWSYRRVDSWHDNA